MWSLTATDALKKPDNWISPIRNWIHHFCTKQKYIVAWIYKNQTVKGWCQYVWHLKKIFIRKILGQKHKHGHHHLWWRFDRECLKTPEHTHKLHAHTLFLQLEIGIHCSYLEMCPHLQIENVRTLMHSRAYRSQFTKVLLKNATTVLLYRCIREEDEHDITLWYICLCPEL